MNASAWSLPCLARQPVHQPAAHSPHAGLLPGAQQQEAGGNRCKDQADSERDNVREKKKMCCCAAGCPPACPPHVGLLCVCVVVRFLARE